MEKQIQTSITTAYGAHIPVVIVHKRVKNLNLRVQTGGKVILSIPYSCPLSVAYDMLERRASWIEEHVSKQKQVLAGRVSQANTPFEMPKEIALWGHPVSARTLLGNLYEEASRSSESFASIVTKIYTREVRERLPQVAPQFETALGVTASRWSVRTMKTRWGSCTPKTRAIRISSSLAAYPLECLELVIAHELVHLIEPSHNEQFHALLDSVIPDNRARSRRLKQPPL